LFFSLIFFSLFKKMPPRSGSRSRFGSFDAKSQTNQRKQRGLAHPILLLEYEKKDTYINFSVLGTSGATYIVRCTPQEPKQSWSCDCPDFTRRHSPCKHIFFVLGRVLEQDVTAEELNLKIKYDLEELYQIVRQRIQLSGTIQNPSAEQELDEQEQKEVKTTAQRAYIGEPCCFCLDVMSATCPVVYCELQCGKSVHRACFLRFIQTIKRKPNLCPYCRAVMEPSNLKQRGKRATAKVKEVVVIPDSVPSPSEEKKEAKEQL
jgi:hypothetical protein